MAEQNNVTMTPENQYLEQKKISKKKIIKRIVAIVFIEILILGVFSCVTFKFGIQNRLIREASKDISGKIRTEKGTYIGKTDFGNFFGKGTFSFKTGTVYSGDWENNKMNGEGVLKIPSEGTYKGTFKNSEKSGNGIYEWKDGTKYEGEWKNDKMWGTGTYTSSSGITYKGTFRENEFEDGECTFNNETGEYVIKYSEGNIVDSLIKFSDGTVYAGQCSGTEIVGTGTMKYSNGDQYNGAFESGKKNGKGIYRWK